MGLSIMRCLDGRYKGRTEMIGHMIRCEKTIIYDFKDLGMSVSVDSSSIILVRQFLPDQSI